MSGDDFTGLVHGLTLYDEAITERVISTLARHDLSTCQRVVGTLLSWSDIRSRVTDSRDVTVSSQSQCLRASGVCHVTVVSSKHLFRSIIENNCNSFFRNRMTFNVSAVSVDRLL